MRFDEIQTALDQAKKHVEDASKTDRFPDMRIQLQLARQVCKRAIDGMEVQIKATMRTPTLGATLPKARRRRPKVIT